MLSDEVLLAVIGALILLLFRDVFGEMIKRLFRGQAMALTEMSALRADIQALKSEAQALKDKHLEYDGVLVAVAELKTEMRLMREAVSTQPSLIAGVVSETIRATLQFVRKGAPNAA